MENRQHTTGQPVGENPHRSLRGIVLLLVAVRYGFLSIGAGFLAWGSAAVLLYGETLSLRAAVEIAVVSVLGPALV